MKKMVNIVVLSSGYGSNLQALIDQIHLKDNIIIQAIICDKDALSLTRGIRANIPTFFLPSKPLNSMNYDDILKSIITIYSPKYVVLSGFMRILSKPFVDFYHNKIINIHPSLLPQYKGLNTHARVLKNNEIEHGVTIHYVTEVLDGGEIIEQRKVPVEHNDTVKSLEKKIKAVERILYPQVIKKLCRQEK